MISNNLSTCDANADIKPLETRISAGAYRTSDSKSAAFLYTLYDRRHFGVNIHREGQVVVSWKLFIVAFLAFLSILLRRGASRAGDLASFSIWGHAVVVVLHFVTDDIHGHERHLPGSTIISML